MNRKSFNLLPWISGISFIIFILGGALVLVSSDKITLGALIFLLGVLIYIVPYLIEKHVYVCPKCNAQFQIPKKEITLISRSGNSAILTCPKCKKTNICFKKLVFKRNSKHN